MPAQSSKVLIVNLSPASEVLVSTALLDQFREYHVTWVVAVENAPVLRGNAWIDELLCVESPARLGAACAPPPARSVWMWWGKADVRRGSL